MHTTRVYLPFDAISRFWSTRRSAAGAFFHFIGSVEAPPINPREREGAETLYNEKKNRETL